MDNHLLIEVVRQKDAMIEELDGQLIATKSTLSDRERELEILRETIVSLSEQLQEKQGQLEELSFLVDTQKEQIQGLKQAAQTLENQIEMKEQRVEVLKSKVEKYEKICIIAPEQKKASNFLFILFSSPNDFLVNNLQQRYFKSIENL
mgnify:CR=1 FL=1